MTLMNEELANCSRGRVLWLLFWNFFKIALFVVGFIKQRKLKAQATAEVPAVKA